MCIRDSISPPSECQSTSTQQLFAQYSVAAQSPLVSQGVSPPGHTFIWSQSRGRSSSVWPGQRMHFCGSHSPPVHESDFVQGTHTAGSSSASKSHPSDTAGLVSTSEHWSVSGLQIVQQPKQSQPGGVSPMHAST